MNNERAIELLHRLQDEQFDGIHGDERREALSMAVRALEGDGDTISRQQAIEAFEPTHYTDWYTPTIIKTLAELPSAQPEQPEIIRCKDCKYRDDDDFCIGRGYPNSLVPDDGFCDKGERSE